MRVRTFILTLLTAGAACAGSAIAETSPRLTPPASENSVPIRAVIELFTSQGCSSCPPADAVLRAISEDPSVIALSMPVDYWDYLGWKDTFASSRNTERQKGYAKARGDGAIYTPQAVINGTIHVNGASRADIERAIETTSNNVNTQRVPLHFWQERNTLNIQAGPADPSRPIREATIWLGVVQLSGTIDVKDGENAGKKLTYTNVVRALTPIGLWKGHPIEIQIPRGAVMLAETQKCVVLIQEGRAGPIIGAAWTGLW